MRIRKKSNTQKNNNLIMSKLEKHSILLKNYSVIRIGLFGSYARGNQKKKSDLDFIVEFSKPTFDNFMNLLSLLESIFNKKVELITKGNISPYILPSIYKEIIWYEIR